MKLPRSQTAWIHQNKADAEAGDEDEYDEDAHIRQYAAESQVKHGRLVIIRV